MKNRWNGIITVILTLALTVFIVAFAVSANAETQLNKALEFPYGVTYMAVTDISTNEKVELDDTQMLLLTQCMSKSLGYKGVNLEIGSATAQTYGIRVLTDDVSEEFAYFTVSATSEDMNFVQGKTFNVAYTGGDTVAKLIANFAAGGNGGWSIEDAGKAYGNAQNGPDEPAAVYGDKTVTMAEIEYQRSINALNSKSETDLEIAQRLITAILVEEAAEEKGLAATTEEIEQACAGTRETYNIPEGREQIDAYCTAAGITVETYFENSDQMMPGVLTRSKMKNSFYADYCAKHGLDASALTQGQQNQAADAYDAWCGELLMTHSADIKYYVK